MSSTITRSACPERTRSDGWTAERQLAFLNALRRTRSVAFAARATGMSRESAYRLRKREPGGLFAATWASCFPPSVERTRAEIVEGHRLAIALACIPQRAKPRPPAPHGQFGDLPEEAISAIAQGHLMPLTALAPKPGLQPFGKDAPQ